jgi:hypothetical protein
MTLPNMDHFNKITSDMAATEAECARAYGIWIDATERLKRLTAMQRREWLRLLDSHVHGETGSGSEK